MTTMLRNVPHWFMTSRKQTNNACDMTSFNEIYNYSLIALRHRSMTTCYEGRVSETTYELNE